MFGKDGGEPLDVGAEVVLLEDAFAAIHGHGGAEGIVVNEGGECADECVEIGGRNSRSIKLSLPSAAS